jgi:hypothetical protein
MPWPHPGYADPQSGSDGYHFPQQAAAETPYEYAPQQWGDPQAPRGYDLGTYSPAAPQGYGPAGAPPFQTAPEAQAPYPGQPQGYGELDETYAEGLDEDEEEPRAGRRGLLIVGALVGAIGLGGALAYTYKLVFTTHSGRAPLVKALDGGPSKTRPETPGGREFAHTDKKLLNRLDDGAGAQQAQNSTGDDRAGEDPNAPRRVRIIPIAPNGQGPVVAGSEPAPQRTATAPVVAVPGLTIDVGPVNPAQAGPQRPVAPEQATAPARPAQQIQPPQPVRIASAAQTMSPQTTDTAAVVPRKTVAKSAAPAVPKTREASAAASAATVSTSGFVAVLSSKKSRMDALKAFADLQQKYGDVLATKTPDVQEADLGEKGVWYRAVVGPPGSREAASGVCSQLKTAGYTGCWVVAY